MNNFIEQGYKCRECDFFGTIYEDIEEHISDSHRYLLAKRRKIAHADQGKSPDAEGQTWKDLFLAIPQKVTETIKTGLSGCRRFMFAKRRNVTRTAQRRRATKEKGWKDVFQITPKVATDLILGSLDHETFLACRQVCRGWRVAVNAYKPTWRKIKRYWYQEALYFAIVQGHKRVAEMLISNAADMMMVPLPSDTRSRGPIGAPLHFATELGDLDMIEMLISNGADVNLIDGDKRTPLHIATEKHNLPAVEVLLTARPNVNSGDGSGQTPLRIAAKDGCSAIAQSLLRHGAKVDWNVLQAAIRGGHSQVFEELLSQGWDVISRDIEALFFMAVRKGQLEIVRCLLNHGAPVNLEQKHGETALHCAAARDHIPVAELLISHGASVNCRNTHGDTPLHLVKSAGMAELLCSHGTSVNIRNTNGNTPLHLARNAEIVEKLFSYGANLTALNRANQTPWYTANARNKYPVYQKIQSLGVLR